MSEGNKPASPFSKPEMPLIENKVQIRGMKLTLNIREVETMHY